MQIQCCETCKGPLALACKIMHMSQGPPSMYTLFSRCNHKTTDDPPAKRRRTTQLANAMHAEQKANWQKALRRGGQSLQPEGFLPTKQGPEPAERTELRCNA